MEIAPHKALGMGFLPAPQCGSKCVLRVFGEEGEGGSSLSHAGHFIWDGAVNDHFLLNLNMETINLERPLTPTGIFIRLMGTQDSHGAHKKRGQHSDQYVKTKRILTFQVK